MIDTSIDSIILDLGGVVVDLDLNRMYTLLASHGVEDPKSIFSLSSQKDLITQFETGQITTEVFIGGFKALTNIEVSDEEVVAIWQSKVLGINAETFEHLLRLKERYDLYALSNTNPIHYQQLNEQALRDYNHSYDDIFKGSAYSFELKTRKPNPDIYQYLIDEYNLEPSTTLYIDDIADNLEPAKQLQLNVLHKPIELSFKKFVMSNL